MRKETRYQIRGDKGNNYQGWRPWVYSPGCEPRVTMHLFSHPSSERARLSIKVRSFRAYIWVVASNPGLTPWAMLKAFSLIRPYFCNLIRSNGFAIRWLILVDLKSTLLETGLQIPIKYPLDCKSNGTKTWSLVNSSPHPLTKERRHEKHTTIHCYNIMHFGISVIISRFLGSTSRGDPFFRPGCLRWGFDVCGGVVWGGL